MQKFIVITIGIILIIVSLFLVKINKFYSKIYTPHPIPKPVPQKTIYNILLFGYGGGNHDGAYLTDTMMLLHVDTKEKKSKILSIPRDLWVKLPTKSGADFHMKINSLYQLELGDSQYYPDIDQSHFGTSKDAEYTEYIVSNALGISVDNYIGVDFSGFSKIIDTLGGVDIGVINSFTDPQYPIDGKETDLCDSTIQAKFDLIKDYINNTSSDPAKLQQIFKDNTGVEDFYNNITSSPDLAFPCRYETLHFDKGFQHMDGTIALKYVRSRHALEDGGDFGRSARQQQLLIAVKSKVLNIGFIPKIIPLLDALGDDVRTDLSPNDIKKFIGMVNTMKDYQLSTYVISDQNLLKNSWSSNNQYILIPKEGTDQWLDLQKNIKDIFISTSSAH